ncbi:MAG: hypothetical protein CVV32_06320 [Methanomicrobiales archaeon HGW-Methanomicrobiales-3]|jgi:hypothetical protein|nr:MAG: hypothetical protein CVV32_06320 [Methanomicrobiales archaeon HGW-Methanomicrobiales-3]
MSAESAMKEGNNITKLRENFQFAQENIETGEKYNNPAFFEKAMGDLQKVVDALLNIFYNKYIVSFSEEDQAVINENLKKLERKTFDALPLGKKMNFLRMTDGFSDGMNFCKKVEQQHNISLNNLVILRDGRFVDIRNKAIHIKDDPASIDWDTVIGQLNLVSAVLTELGYPGFYEYAINRYNNFVDKFRQAGIRFSCAPDSPVKIDENIISGFTRDGVPVNLVQEIRESGNNFQIIGEGGIGKSTMLRTICEKFTEENRKIVKKTVAEHQDTFLPIPVWISASRLKVSGALRYEINDFRDDVAKLSGKKDLDILSEAEKLAALYDDALGKDKKPVFILLLDGFNEINGLNDEIKGEFLSIFEFLSEKRIQIVLTSRVKLPSPGKKTDFIEVYAKGLDKETIERYIQAHLNESTGRDIGNKLSSKKMLEVLKNPMYLTLYTGYQYDKDSESSQQNIHNLIRQKKLNIIDTPVICKSYILWNFVQYKILYHNVYRPLLEEVHSPNAKIRKSGLKFFEREQDKHIWIISEFVQKTAWEMVSKGQFEIEFSNAPTEGHNPGARNSKEILDYLSNTLGLIKYDGATISFSHQNFRDFFAACYYIKNYMQLIGDNKDENKLHEQLRSEFIPSDIKKTVGELLGELEESRSIPLKRILKEYQDAGNAGPVYDHTVENIFEIHKSLNTLCPVEFLNTDIERLNFNDVESDKIIVFVKNTLDTISIDLVLSDVTSLKDMEKNVTLKKLKNLFMLSARCANNLQKDDIRRMFYVWLRWTRSVYRNETKNPSTSLTGRITYRVLSSDKLTIFLLSNVIYTFLAGGNVGIGKNGFLNIFQEVGNSKNDYQDLMEILEKEGKEIDNSKIIDPVFRLASRSDYAANFVCFILDYYLYHNVDAGLDLIRMLREKIGKEQTDHERETNIRFRIMSGLNYCVQESKCHGKHNPAVFKEKFKPIMNEFLDSELENFSDNIATEYKNFKYGYYFPFGILFTFDNGTDDDETVRKVLTKIFPGDGSLDLLLFQKVILDIACISAGTFFVQNENYTGTEAGEAVQNSQYLENTFDFFEALILKLYPSYTIDSPYEKDNIVWESLLESLAIVYCSYPSKTEEFLDRLYLQYLEDYATEKQNKVLSLKSNLRQATEKKFVHLCNAGLNEKEYKIREFVENYKNVLIFADLANNAFISFPNVTKSLVLWGEDSFYKNIDVYKHNPKKFINQTLYEVISICKTPNFYEIKLDN